MQLKLNCCSTRTSYNIRLDNMYTSISFSLQSSYNCTFMSKFNAPGSVWLKN